MCWFGCDIATFCDWVGGVRHLDRSRTWGIKVGVGLLLISLVIVPEADQQIENNQTYTFLCSSHDSFHLENSKSISLR